MKEEIDFEKIIEEINIDEVILKRRNNGLLLSDKQIEILKKYQFDYTKYTNLSSLIYDIEYYLNECTDADDL